MAQQWMAVSKPSRSDNVLPPEEQLRITKQIRAQFDAMAPQRPIKPRRSESDVDPVNVSMPASDVCYHAPEIERLQTLQSQGHVVLGIEGGDLVQDEFVETEYYKELGSIDKQHHTTGTGFIKAVRENSEEDGYNVQLQNRLNGNAMSVRSFRSNPATNDWIPTVEDEERVIFSSKPVRSEGW